MTNNRIDILTVTGSPRGVTTETLYKRGVGGAELALLSWAEIMSIRGHEIHIYNDPIPNQLDIHYQSHPGLQFHPFHSFDSLQKRDALITFRGPTDITNFGLVDKKIGWSCDQFTVGDYINWYQQMDEIILISEFHKADHIRRYGDIVNQKGHVLDLGVRTWEYDNSVEKIPYQFIFCSVPDRGLNEIAYLWPQIKTKYPEATLIITSDYTLWGSPEPLNLQYRMKFVGMEGVKFVGNVSRSELVKYQLESEVQLYPCNYDENFCIATAECQVAGCYCITTNKGALETTNFLGKKVETNDFEGMLRLVDDYFVYPTETRHLLSRLINQKATERFAWENIANEWEKILNV